MPTTASATGPAVVDNSGVRIGTVDENGQVRDFAGVHTGSLAADREGVVVDFSGVRIGHVAGDQR